MLHAHIQSFLPTLALVCLLVKLPSFRPSQINVYVYKCWNNPNKISFKKEGLPSCSECFNFFVRHLGTFVNASHNWYTIRPLPKSWWHITMNCSGDVIRQLQAYVLNLLFSWKFEHKCGFGDLLTFIISCICVEGYNFLFQWYLHKLCNVIIKK